MVEGLLVFLMRLWGGTINVSKFNKFFMDGAIEQSMGTWWDATG